MYHKCALVNQHGDVTRTDCDYFIKNCVGAMDHVRVHPKFLHSNATSHKWALGGMCVRVMVPVLP